MVESYKNYRKSSVLERWQVVKDERGIFTMGGTVYWCTLLLSGLDYAEIFKRSGASDEAIEAAFLYARHKLELIK